MKKIIVATDFSPASLNAATYAVAMAETINAEILLFHVLEVIANYGEIIIDINVEDLKRLSENDMTAFKSKLLLNTGYVGKTTSLVRLGVFKNELEDICKTEKPYVVVIGCQGKTAVERIIFGGHAVSLIKSCPWPLIAVPLNAVYKSIKNIGLLYDFKEDLKLSIVEEIKLFVQDFDACIHILNAAREDEFNTEFVHLSGKIEEYFAPLEVKYHFFNTNDIDESVIKFADRNKIDLLIVLPKHRNMLEQLMHKSHSKQMVLHSHVPVMALGN
ncbi:MAG: universal stress protein [Ferruginibacter sp.]